MKNVKTDLKNGAGIYLGLCGTCSVISVLGLLSLGADQLDSYSKALTQAVAALTGLGMAWLVSKVDYRQLIRFWPVYTFGLWALVLPTLVLHNVSLGPLTIGYDVGGTGNYGWYRLGPYSFQPSELAKVGFLLSFSAHLEWAGHRLNRPGVLAGLLAHLAVPVALIHFQGDDGTALVFVGAGLIMLFGAGLSWKYILGGAALASTAGAVAFTLWGDRLLKSYQMARILALFCPDDPAYQAYAYQQDKGVMAIGAGQLWGEGLFSSSHTYIPYAWNDFIFSYLGECLGFFGCALILGLLFGIMAGTLTVAGQAEDRAGRGICMGVFGMLLVQTALNVGMNLRLLPVVGVTLPFFSAGGTSTWMGYLSAGLVLSVMSRNKGRLFGR